MVTRKTMQLQRLVVEKLKTEVLQRAQGRGDECDTERRTGNWALHSKKFWENVPEHLSQNGGSDGNVNRRPVNRTENMKHEIGANGRRSKQAAGSRMTVKTRSNTNKQKKREHMRVLIRDSIQMRPTTNRTGRNSMGTVSGNNGHRPRQGGRRSEQQNTTKHWKKPMNANARNKTAATRCQEGAKRREGFT